MPTWDLSDEVLEQYIETFYGQGSWKAPYWFVGMEFGGGGSVAEIVSRIQGWYDRGAKDVEDLAGPGGTDNNSKWFRPPYPLQPTWRELIRIVLTAEGTPPGKEQIRAYQKNHLGRAGGLDWLLELLPLPSPNAYSWQFYPDHSQLPYLRSRKTYEELLKPRRAARLRAKVLEHRPRAVVFYGNTHRYWWNVIATANFRWSSVEGVAIADDGNTRFLKIPHPAARQLSSAEFEAVGRLIVG